MKEDITLVAVAALIFIGSLVIAHEVGWSRAATSTEAAAQAREARINADHAQALATVTQRERDAETRARDELDIQVKNFRQEINDEKTKRDRFVADVRSGAVRLSIPIRGNAHCAAAAGADAAPGPRDRDETRTELAPQAGIDLAAIADDGDDGIKQLNACIDSYNTVRARFNALDNAQAR